MARINWLGILQPTSNPALPAQPGGCAQCHPSLGKKPNPVDQLTQDDYNNIDCLICHATNYTRTVAANGASFKIVPAPGVDVLAAARSAQKPTNAMCLRCHLSTGGGPNAKHGDVATPNSGDVHITAGKQCIDCHPTSEHKIAGAADLKLHEQPNVVVSCTNCHNPQNLHSGENAAIDGHLERVACQTCHIPAVARDPAYPTHVLRDWSQPKLLPNGLYGPTNQPVSNLTPTYLWWNGKVTSPPGPLGDLADATAKIMPWKEWEIIAPRDAVSKTPIPLKAGVYSVTGDVGLAVQRGAQDSGTPYSGQWEPFTETVYFSNNHQVAPAAQALRCQDCHSAEGRLDFAELGYPDEMADSLQNGRVYRVSMPLMK